MLLLAQSMERNDDFFSNYSDIWSQFGGTPDVPPNCDHISAPNYDLVQTWSRDHLFGDHHTIGIMIIN